MAADTDFNDQVLDTRYAIMKPLSKEQATSEPEFFS